MPAHMASHRSRSTRRRGGARGTIFFGLAALGLLGAAAWVFWPGGEGDLGPKPLLTPVVLGPYDNVVVEQGEVESSNNVEVKCQVRSRNSGGIDILWVIPEGSIVEEGELLVRLDSSALEEERNRQQIVCNTSLASKIQSQSSYEAALIARTEYLEGAYEQERQSILSEIFVSEENLRRATQYEGYSERLSVRGYVTSLQLEGDRFAVEKTRNELDLARRKLRVLEQYTREKLLKQFDSDIASAQARMESDVESYRIEMLKLEELDQQIKLCEIFSPKAGQVVYANVYSSRGSSEFVVEAGSRVREGQTIIRIPDPTRMQIKARINESRVTSVMPRMPVSIRIDALGDQLLRGEVLHVNEYAEPTSYFGSNVKRYATTIRIFDPPPNIRPGLTAEARIHVEQLPSALQAPVQTVYEYKRHTFVLVNNGDRYETREVTIGSSNDKMVTIVSGLNVGDQLVMNPRQHADRFVLPELPDPPAMAPREEPPAELASVGPPVGARGGPPAGENGQFVARGGDAPRGEGARSGGQRGGPPGGGPGGGGGDPATVAAAIFSRLDTNGDGVLSGDELNDETRSRFADADSNGDGSITRAELEQSITRRRAQAAAVGGPVGDAAGAQ